MFVSSSSHSNASINQAPVSHRTTVPEEAPSRPSSNSIIDLESGHSTPDMQCCISHNPLNPLHDNIIWVETAGEGHKLRNRNGNFTPYEADSLKDWCATQQMGQQIEPLTRIPLKSLQLFSSTPSSWPDTTSIKASALPYRQILRPEFTVARAIPVIQNYYAQDRYRELERLNTARNIQVVGYIGFASSIGGMAITPDFPVTECVSLAISTATVMFGIISQYIVERRLFRRYYH